MLLECVDFYMLRKRDKDPETELKALIKVSQPGVNRTSVLRPASLMAKHRTASLALHEAAADLT